jgi:isopenicillin N synthase-like dioxygenase
MAASAQNCLSRLEDVMTTDSVPVIDIARLDARESLSAIDAACREWGFFQVIDHGIDAALICALMQQMRAFFAQPSAAKRSICRTADNPWGFFDAELTKNTLDWKEVYDYGPADGVMQPQWPAQLPEFEPVLCAYYTACERLAFRLLAALSKNLGMPAPHLGAGFRPTHSSFVRLNHYPRCPLPERPADVRTPRQGHLGINHHTDAGALTLLLQDAQPGLEVWHDDRWHLVEPRRNALVINIGDIVQVWSNDAYRAALHRVVASVTNERFSAPFFFNPAYSACYAPLPSTVDMNHPPRYRAIRWGEFRRRRSAGDYADLGEEVQISHYRLGGSES